LIDKTATLENANLDGDNYVYKFARIRETTLKEGASVGDFSKVDYSCIGEKVRIDRFNHIYKSNIDRYSYTGMNSVIMCSTIGKFCSISWGVTIGGAEHDYKKVTTHSFLYNDFYNLKPNDYIAYDRFSKKCELGNDVWIGCNSTILRGVKISNGAVIGANSLVNIDIPSYSIAVGNPAKIVKFRFNDEIIELLEKLQWWNWSEEKIRNNFSFFEKIPTKEDIILMME